MSAVLSTIALVVILSAVIRYIIKEKKKGVKCIGCPSAGSCQGSACCNLDYDEILASVIDNMNK